jgi:hypothetical protein
MPNNILCCWIIGSRSERKPQNISESDPLVIRGRLFVLFPQFNEHPYNLRLFSHFAWSETLLETGDLDMSPRLFRVAGKGFLGLRLVGMWLRDA